MLNRSEASLVDKAEIFCSSSLSERTEKSASQWDYSLYCITPSDALKTFLSDKLLAAAFAQDGRRIEKSYSFMGHKRQGHQYEDRIDLYSQFQALPKS